METSANQETSAPSAVIRKINLDAWTAQQGYSQAVEVTNAQKVLYCAGMTALDENGSLPSALDMRSQILAALGNVERILSASGYGLADVVRLILYTTAMDEAVQNLDLLVTRLRDNDCRPALTGVEVSRLFLPELLVEIEATAVR